MNDMKIASPPHLVAGVALGLFLLIFVHKFDVFGDDCYFIGSFEHNPSCIPPFLYYFAWLAALALGGYGLFKRPDAGTTPEYKPPQEPL